MIEYLLVLQVCATAIDCQWQRVAKYPTETLCVANGLAQDPLSIRFKCIGIESRAYNDHEIPLPRPRPGGPR